MQNLGISLPLLGHLVFALLCKKSALFHDLHRLGHVRLEASMCSSFSLSLRVRDGLGDLESASLKETLGLMGPLCLQLKELVLHISR